MDNNKNKSTSLISPKFAAHDGTDTTSNVVNNHVNDESPLTKPQLEAEKLNLEIETLRAKLRGKEKPSAWEVFRTAFTWVGVIGPIILSIVAYTYQRGKDRESNEYQRERDRQVTEQQREKDRQLSEQQKAADLRQQEKDQAEARKQRTAELHQQIVEAKDRRTKEIQTAIELINKGNRASGVSQLALYGEEGLPVIVGNVKIYDSTVEWPLYTFAALSAIQRIGVNKLKRSDLDYLRQQVNYGLAKLDGYIETAYSPELRTPEEAKATMQVICAIKQLTGTTQEWESKLSDLKARLKKQKRLEVEDCR